MCNYKIENPINKSTETNKELYVSFGVNRCRKSDKERCVCVILKAISLLYSANVMGHDICGSLDSGSGKTCLRTIAPKTL